jgi:hypothetical protein
MAKYASSTSVSSEHRRAEIERTLNRYGATGFGYAAQSDPAMAMVEFLIGGRRIRFMLTLPDPNEKAFTHTPNRGTRRSKQAADAEYEQAVRQRWAALHLVIRAKLEAIEAGISTLDAEFLANIMLPGGSTVGDVTLPQLDAVYAGTGALALLPGATR